MDQLAMLWQYQVEDRKADKLEQELSRSPLRQKMNTCSIGRRSYCIAMIRCKLGV